MLCNIDYKDIPIFILSYNRLHCLKLLIKYLENKGYTNISIIDNHSSYPPLLNYLQNIKYKVFHMDKNYGHKVFWINEIFKNITETQYYVVTDPDILPIQQCPDDFIKQFYEILQKNSSISKVGFSLKIDDIPDYYELKEYVIKWEQQFYAKDHMYKNYKIYYADIDTTFALYKPTETIFSDNNFYMAIRTGYPYQARHLAWYVNSKQPSEEDIFYKQHTISSYTTWYHLDEKLENMNWALKNKMPKTKQMLLKLIKFFINLIPIKSFRRRLRNILSLKYENFMNIVDYENDKKV